MKATRIRAHCPRCRHDQNFVRGKVNHGLHLFLTLVTFGLWGIGWISATIGMHFRPWRCQHCGWHKPDFDISRSKREPLSTTPTPADPPEQGKV